MHASRREKKEPSADSAAGEEEKPTGALGYLKHGFSSVVDTAKELGKKTKSKLEEAKIGEKFTKAKAALAQQTAAAGTYMAQKSKQISVLLHIRHSLP